MDLLKLANHPIASSVKSMAAYARRSREIADTLMIKFAWVGGNTTQCEALAKTLYALDDDGDAQVVRTQEILDYLSSVKNILNGQEAAGDREKFRRFLDEYPYIGDSATGSKLKELGNKLVEIQKIVSHLYQTHARLKTTELQERYAKAMWAASDDVEPCYADTQPVRNLVGSIYSIFTNGDIGTASDIQYLMRETEGL